MQTIGLPQGYKERAGDIVILRAKVCHDWRPDTDNKILVEVEGRYSSILINRESIVGIDTLKFNVGEKVLSERHGQSGTIAAIHGNYAWVDFGIKGVPDTVHLSKLVRFEETLGDAEAA